MTPEEEQGHIDEVRRVVWTGCPSGCGPDGHQWPCTVGRPLPGPLRLFIDRDGTWHWFPARRRARRARDLLKPRPGCCAICGGALDQQALRVGDDRCSSCYRAIFAEHRRRQLGDSG